jgi:hypothetical protein
MANNLLISVAARNAAMDAITALLNAGGAGTIDIYDGTQPAGPGTAVTTQVRLVTLTYSTTAYGAAVNGVATANAITSGTAIAAGTATWARRKSGAGTAVIDASVGTANADIILGTTTISVGLVVPLTSDTLTHPA